MTNTTAHGSTLDSQGTPSFYPTRAPANKPLWAAVGVLSAAVIAMGGTMLYRQGAQSALASVTTAQLSVPATTLAKTGALPQASGDAADDLIEKPAAVEAKKATPKPAAAPAPAPRYAAVSPAPRPAPTYSRAAPDRVQEPVRYLPAAICATCGTVESVNAVQRASKPAPISVGSVAGGVVGAVLGNQVGGGNGRKLATVLGAVGGGYAGHVIEGQVRKVTVYEVNVRMEDGTRRTIEAPTAPAIGSRVTVDGGTLQGQGGGSYSNASRPAPVSVGYSPELTR